jgi:hypothetical protein
MFDFVTEFGLEYNSVLEMERDVFHEICEHINSRNKKERKMTQQEKDMIAESKNDEWWKVK